MREYELTVVYDLAVQEAGGPDAGPERLTSLIEGRGGKMLKVDHWGRRRMAYPINRALDGSRPRLSPRRINFRFQDRFFRHSRTDPSCSFA